jgi:hypothetical protein
MSFLADQLIDYPRVHTTRANLLIHIVAVPVFDVAILGAVASLATRSWLAAAGGVVIAAAAFAAEGRGHGIEPEPPIPFAGPGDVVRRIFAEQFITFPRFVFSGGWRRVLQAASAGPGPGRTGDAPS